MSNVIAQNKGSLTMRKRRRSAVWRTGSLVLTVGALASSVHGYPLQRPLAASLVSTRRVSRCIKSPPKPSTTVLYSASTLPTALAGNSYMVLLALQFAFQPIVTKAYASKSLIKGTYVVGLDCIRAVICVMTLLLTNTWTSATAGWSWRDAALSAGLPSMLYVAQNYFALQAYQNLSPITFNVLNQTKTLSAALWCFLLLGQSLDVHQVGALGILLLAALVMEKMIPLPFSKRITEEVSSSKAAAVSTETVSSVKPHDPWLGGVVPVLLASLLSGLAGALAQGALQGRQRNSLLFSLELAACSLVTSTLTLGILPTPDHRRLVKQGWWQGWTLWTWIPLVLQAAGGVLVGLVTKHAGSVRKGFCLIQGMFLSGVLQNLLDKDGSNHVRVEQWIGGVLAALSFWMYTQ